MAITSIRKRDMELISDDLTSLLKSISTPRKVEAKLNIHLTNQDLAKFCAATRESVNRLLGDLKKKNMIQKDSDGKIIIQNTDYLREQNGCDDCPTKPANEA